MSDNQDGKQWTRRELRLKEKAAYLRSQLEALGVLVDSVTNPPLATLGPGEWADFEPCNTVERRIRPIRKFKHAYAYASQIAPDAAIMGKLLSVPMDMVQWLLATAKPGERVVLEVCW